MAVARSSLPSLKARISEDWRPLGNILQENVLKIEYTLQDVKRFYSLMNINKIFLR
jgi:hypothetical protein